MDVFSGVAAAARPQFEAAARFAASELGLWAALAAPLGLPEAARAVGASEHRLAALLDVLVLSGDLSRSAQGRFAIAGALRPAPTPVAAGWGLLAQVLRRDAPLDEPGVSGAAGDPLERFHRHLCSAGAAAAQALCAPLARAARGAGPPLLLDLGSGAGAYAAAFLAADPEASCALLDRPAVLSLARAALAPYTPRATFLEADLRTPWPALPAPADAALLANLLHLFGPDEAQSLVARAARAVRPGGLVVVKDLRLHDDHRGPAVGVLFSLNMALFTERGRVHDEAALRGLLGGAGLAEVALTGLEGVPDAVVATGRVPPEGLR